MLPLSYPIRNLWRRPWRTAMTVGGIAVVVFAAVLMMSVCHGLFERLGSTGEPENLLAISRKGQNIMFSSVEEVDLMSLWDLPGLAVGSDGLPLVSPELMHVSIVTIADPDGGTSAQAPIRVRGVLPIAYAVHRSVEIVEGRLPENDFELLAGATAHVKLAVPAERLAVGQKVRFENKEWTVCGRFSAGGAMIESETWVQEQNLQTVLCRQTHSFVISRFESPDAAQAGLAQFERTGAVQRTFKAWAETAYYREHTKSLTWVFWLSVSMVAAVALAGCLIGMNTMYTSIITRLKEIATLRVLGFPRRSVLWTTGLESAVMALMGGVAGVLPGMLVNDLPMRFSHGAFYISVAPVVMLAGLALSLVIGLLGTLFPVFKGLRLGVADALRR